jgi:hypothetical protein
MEVRFTKVHQLLVARDFKACNKVLEDFDPDGSETIVGVGMLRASFAARDHLPAWWDLLEKMEQRVVNKRLLRGLKRKEHDRQ